jgi:hypothetical protein
MLNNREIRYTRIAHLAKNGARDARYKIPDTRCEIRIEKTNPIYSLLE